jgi:hypothetical protein
VHRPLLGALAALLLTASTAHAQGTPKRTYFFQCASGAKVQNVNSFRTDLRPSWSLLPPTGTLQSGAGCGFFDTPLAGTAAENPYDAIYGGLHDEAVERIDVELHDLVLGRARPGATRILIVRLNVGGTEIANKTLTVTPVAGATPATEITRFAFEGLKLPGGTKQRRITLTVDSLGTAFVHGASDAPASITFTPPVR